MDKLGAATVAPAATGTSIDLTQQIKEQEQTDHLIKIMNHNYTTAESCLIILLTLASISAFYPLIHMLNKVHKRKGFDIVFAFASIVTNLFYKIILAFGY